MSFALPTLVLIFLLAPGLVFRRSYFRGAFSDQYFKASFSDLLISTIVPSIVIHWLLYYLLVKGNYTLDVKALAILFSGTNDTKEVKIAFYHLFENIGPIFGYLVMSVITAALLGFGTQLIVRKSNLDKKFQFFRFQNHWHYYFSGEVLDFPNIPGEKTDVNLTCIDVLIDTSGGPVIYTGYLSDYKLGKDGGVDMIYLTKARRRFLNEDGKKQYYEMPGEFFAFRFSDVRNIHITYYQLLIKESDPLPAKPANP